MVKKLTTVEHVIVICFLPHVFSTPFTTSCVYVKRNIRVRTDFSDLLNAPDYAVALVGHHFPDIKVSSGIIEKIGQLLMIIGIRAKDHSIRYDLRVNTYH